MSCEKASRRLRSLISKARRLGLSAEEVADLPATKRLLPTKVTAGWTTIATLFLVLAGSIALVIFCAPCLARTVT